MRSKRPVLLPGTRLSVAAALALLPTAQTVWAQEPSPAETPATNPHWSADGCPQCHQTDTPSAPDFTPKSIEDLCSGCHDGKRALKSAHPSLRPLYGPQFRRPGGWPLVENLIGCLTCHDVLAGCREHVRRPDLNPAFLRGYDGQDLAAFCNNCHIRGQAQRFNPHLMLTPDGSPMASVCTHCHVGVPSTEPARTPDPQASALRYDVPTLCMSCHTRHVDYFEPGHLHARVSPERKAYMVAFERAPAGQPPGKNAIRQALRQGFQPTRLRLADGDRLVCTTCHNPHPEGVFPPDSIQASGAIRPGASPRTLGLRYGPAELCRACHRK